MCASQSEIGSKGLNKEVRQKSPRGGEGGRSRKSRRSRDEVDLQRGKKSEDSHIGGSSPDLYR